MKKTYPKFTVGNKLTEEQIAFFNKNGFIHFEGALKENEVQGIINSTEVVQNKWITEGRKKINGVPIKFGVDENGKSIVHRFCFTSQYSEAIHNLVRDNRITALKVLM